MSKKRKAVSWIDSKNENNNNNDHCENCHRRDYDIAGKKVDNIEIIGRSSEKFHWKKNYVILRKSIESSCFAMSVFSYWKVIIING